jgi:hypothetical protein
MDLSMTSAMEILVTNRHDPYVKMSITSLLDHHINNIHGENIRERERATAATNSNGGTSCHL